MRRMSYRSLICLAVVATMSGASRRAVAQDQPVPANLLRIPLRAEQPVRVQVDSIFLEGRYTYAHPDSITLRIGRSFRSVHARDVQGMWVKRSRALPAAIIVGTATGLLGGLMFSGVSDGSCDPAQSQCDSRLLPFLRGFAIVGGVGAGVGSAIGAAFTRWVPLRTAEATK
jgi:hypothetical protein